MGSCSSTPAEKDAKLIQKLKLSEDNAVSTWADLRNKTKSTSATAAPDLFKQLAATQRHVLENAAILTQTKGFQSLFDGDLKALLQDDDLSIDEDALLTEVLKFASKDSTAGAAFARSLHAFIRFPLLGVERLLKVSFIRCVWLARSPTDCVCGGSFVRTR